MTRMEQLANRFKEVILNGTWVANTNFKDQLTPLHWDMATKTYGTLNSIAVLAQHIHYYIEGVKQVLLGGELLIKDTHSFDFPPIKNQQEWEAFLDRFWSDAEALASAIEQLPEEQLDQYFVKETYGTYDRNMEGMIEHCYYHLGQIVLIKKGLIDKVSRDP